MNFIENMFISWPNDPSLTTPKPKQTQQNAGFIIRHFAGDVFYNAVCTKESQFYIDLQKRKILPKCSLSNSNSFLIHFLGQFYREKS